MADIEQQARALLAAEWERDGRNFTARAIRDGRAPSDEAAFQRAIGAIVAALAAQPQASKAAIPAAWRAFVAACADTRGCMVDGNNLALQARELLAAVAAPELSNGG